MAVPRLGIKKQILVPCKNCEKRVVGCQAKCCKYAAFKILKKREDMLIRKAYIVEAELDRYEIQRSQKGKK